MNTLILRETTRVLFALILVFSVSTLLRGHDGPWRRLRGRPDRVDCLQSLCLS